MVTERDSVGVHIINSYAVASASTAFSLSDMTTLASVDTDETYATELLLSPTQIILLLDGTGGERSEAYDYTAGDASLPTSPWSSTDTLTATLTNPRALCWGNNGQYLYQGHQFSGAQVVRRTLTTSYDIGGGATYSRSSTSNPTGIQGMAFKPDGLTFFLLGANNRIYTCTTTTAWDVSTYTADSGTLITSDVDGDGDSVSGGTGIRFNTDGTRMYICYRINGNDPDTDTSGQSKIIQYDLSTAWDVTSRSVSATKSLHPDLGYFSAPPSAVSCLVAGFDWSADGSELLVASVHEDALTSEFRVLRYKA
jgi:hypothetical protein